MAHLVIRFTKHPDGSNVLHCARPDGTAVWQRQVGGYFPLHDLTHYVVETTLELGDAFFGLLARGWTFADFGKPWPRGPLPPEAAFAEYVVGLLQAERASGTEQDAADFNAWLAKAPAGGALPTPVLTDAELGRIRTAVRELFVRWRAVPVGEMLELTFPVGAPRR